MLFDSTPKEKIEDLFGVDFILNSLLSYIEDKTVRLIVIRGMRRTGKTSLLNVLLKETSYLNLKIDVRETPYYNMPDFMSYFVERIKITIGESLFKRIINKISGLSLSYDKINTTIHFNKDKEILLFIADLDKQLKEENKILLIAFDEIQLLNKIKFNNLIAAIYDNYKNIKIIITGSEIGLVDNFIGAKDAESPLFGRALIEVETKRLESEQTSQFLNAGFNQINKKISLEEIKEVIEVLDGIIGWANYYGWLRSKNISHSKSIIKVIEEGSELTKRELNNFLSNRKQDKYLKVLRWIKKGYSSWGLLKDQFIKNKIKISDRQLAIYLKELMDYSFIELIGKDYRIIDPLLLKSLEQ